MPDTAPARPPTPFRGVGPAGPAAGSVADLARDMMDPLAAIQNAAYLLLLTRDEAIVARLGQIVARQADRLVAMLEGRAGAPPG